MFLKLLRLKTQEFLNISLLIVAGIESLKKLISFMREMDKVKQQYRRFLIH
jgi:hypothetical protein